jgi:hypothetical protein
MLPEILLALLSLCRVVVAFALFFGWVVSCTFLIRSDHQLVGVSTWLIAPPSRLPSFACAGWCKENLAEDKSLASVGAVADRMEKLFVIGISKVDACFGHLRSHFCVYVRLCTSSS